MFISLHNLLFAKYSSIMTEGESDRLATIIDLHSEMLAAISHNNVIIKGSFTHNSVLEFGVFHISEIIHNYSREFKAKHRQINWQEFREIRNNLAHTYSPNGYVSAWWAATELIPETIGILQKIEKNEAAAKGKSSAFNRSGISRGSLVRHFGVKKRSRKLRLEEIVKISSELKAICMKYGASNIAIFGSVARGDENSKSDVDFLVDMTMQISLGFRDLSAQKTALKSELSRILKCKVDVCLRAHLKSTVLKAALRDEVLI